MHVIGTAGHVDHGKSTLVSALTGINPDRLKEERERQMTIDLGFAWMTLPDGEIVGIIDVPGHRDFIENMLAGVGGIDTALFVIAADEGIMPQTREHLAILDILKVQSGVIALTKIDLVEAPDWIELVEEDIRTITTGTVLNKAPIIRVSAKNGVGLNELKAQLSLTIHQQPVKPDIGRPRLPIDRVFTITGFGTVVTGTLLDGKLHIGDEVEILPKGYRGRIRGLQTYQQQEEIALPGSRAAINLSGINPINIKRGDVVCIPGCYKPSQLLDVHFQMLRDSGEKIKHNANVKLFHGASEIQTRVRLLGVEELLSGEEGWLQLDLSNPIVAVKGDHYLLRRPSPGETLGGGVIVDVHPGKYHKRFNKDVLLHLETLRFGSSSEILLQTIRSLGPAPFSEAAQKSGLDNENANTAIKELALSGRIYAFNEGELSINSNAIVIAKDSWNKMVDEMVTKISDYHQLHPLRMGIPREQLKSELKVTQIFFNTLIRKSSQDGVVEESERIVKLKGHEVCFSRQQEENVKGLVDSFEQSPYSPPTIIECKSRIGEELYNALVDDGRLIPVSNEVVFLRDNYDRMVHEVIDQLRRGTMLTVAIFRDRYKTSRRYAQAFLEHLDDIGITVRDGDARKLSTKNRQSESIDNLLN